jgi:hypothetical protein
MNRFLQTGLGKGISHLRPQLELNKNPQGIVCRHSCCMTPVGQQTVFKHLLHQHHFPVKFRNHGLLLETNDVTENKGANKGQKTKKNQPGIE